LTDRRREGPAWCSGQHALLPDNSAFVPTAETCGPEFSPDVSEQIDPSIYIRQGLFGTGQVSSQFQFN
uniref:Alpha-carbonic anhydrase domain-containing protein n=1 Tax=Angiostrongylus cantonensis TaxID=6313 RepID=A0A0K0DMX4_ANGCA